MSNGMNRVVLLGNLGTDPEVKQLPTGALMKLRLATTESFKGKDDERQDRTEWHDVVLWGPRAAALAPYLSKGMCLLVEGSLRTTSYEKEGSRRYRTEVVARDICFTGDRSRPDQSDVMKVRSEVPSLARTLHTRKSPPPLPSQDQIPF